eukprot:3648042-Rhodomonas_salina.1
MESERKREREKAPVCVCGVAVVWGTPTRQASCSPAELDAALLRSTQTDNPKFISHLIRDQGWRPDSARSNCNFAIIIDDASVTAGTTTKLEGVSGDEEQAAPTNMSSSAATEQVWRVSSATPLHLALSCGSFKAAAVLLIAFPEFATQVGNVGRAATACFPRLDDVPGMYSVLKWHRLSFCSAAASSSSDMQRHHANLPADHL